MGSKESTEKYYPEEANLGKPCQAWNLNGRIKGCNYPKAGLEGRMSCEGVIDDVCLNKIYGRVPKGLTSEKMYEIKSQIPDINSAQNLPPGDIEK